jgi:hypothetical protein
MRGSAGRAGRVVSLTMPGRTVTLTGRGRVSPSAAEMYPRLAEFAKLRAELDPAGILASDLSGHLGL